MPRGHEGTKDTSINHELYLMAGRLSTLYQADLTNRMLVRDAQRKLNCAVHDRGDDCALRDMRAAAARSHEVLEQARQTMREGWIKIHRFDREPSPSPLFFAGEDFLSTLLIVDSMAECDDAQKWFLHVAQRLMYFQEFEGGLNTDQHVVCPWEKNPCPGCDNDQICDKVETWCCATGCSCILSACTC